MFNTPSKFILILVGAGILVVSALYYADHLEQKGYDKAVLEYQGILLEAETKARISEQIMTKNLEEARNEATTKSLEIDKLNRDLSNTSRSLRDTITASKNRINTDSTEALRITADTALTVFGECQARYGEMAETADRHALDVEMLLKAWPKY